MTTEQEGTPMTATAHGDTSYIDDPDDPLLPTPPTVTEWHVERDHDGAAWVHIDMTRRPKSQVWSWTRTVHDRGASTTSGTRHVEDVKADWLDDLLELDT